jgi:diguanylate cyclase (GGDEF)-like protein
MGYQPTNDQEPQAPNAPVPPASAAGAISGVPSFASTASMQSLLYEHFAALQDENETGVPESFSTSLPVSEIPEPDLSAFLTPQAPHIAAPAVPLAVVPAPSPYALPIPEIDDEAQILAQLTAGAARVVADITEETRLKAEAANAAPSYAQVASAPVANIRPVEDDVPAAPGIAEQAYDIAPYDLPTHVPGVSFVQTPSLKMVPMPVNERKPDQTARSHIAIPAQPPLDPNDPKGWPLSAKILIEELKAENDKLKAALREEASRALMAESLAETDVLTPTLNRRGFVRELQRAIADCKRYGEKACVIFLDLDGFKLINDTYGHDAGDTALIHVANVLRQNIREGDAVGRLGGDEFALLLRRAELQPTRVKAMMLEAELSVSTFAYKNLYLKVGGSFGVRAFMGQNTADEWLAEADAAMFLVKKSIR